MSRSGGLVLVGYCFQKNDCTPHQKRDIWEGWEELAMWVSGGRLFQAEATVQSLYAECLHEYLRNSKEGPVARVEKKKTRGEGFVREVKWGTGDVREGKWEHMMILVGHCLRSHWRILWEIKTWSTYCNLTYIVKGCFVCYALTWLSGVGHKSTKFR